MLENYSLAYGGILPSFLANALQKMLGLAAFQFVVDKVDDTHVQVAASAGDGAAAVSIGGKWRWNEATVGPVAVPGGAANIFPVFVTCADNSIVSTPAPFTDATNYAFGLQVKPNGSTPTIVPGTVDFYRQVATIEWDGTRILRITSTVPATAAHGLRHAIGGPDPIRGMNQLGKRLLGNVNCFVPGGLAAGTYLILSDGSLLLAGSVLPLSKGWEHWWLDPQDYKIRNVTGDGMPHYKIGIRSTAVNGTAAGAGVLIRPRIVTPGIYSVAAGRITPTSLTTIVDSGFAINTTGLIECDSFALPVSFTPFDFFSQAFVPAINISGGSTAAQTDMRINMRAYIWFDTDDAPYIL